MSHPEGRRRELDKLVDGLKMRTFTIQLFVYWKVFLHMGKCIANSKECITKIEVQVNKREREGMGGEVKVKEMLVFSKPFHPITSSGGPRILPRAYTFSSFFGKHSCILPIKTLWKLLL